MTAILEKIQQVEHEISSERGGVVLFALLEREDSPGKWDVLFSASWVPGNETHAIRYLLEKLLPKLTLRQKLSLSRVIALKPADEFVEQLRAVAGGREGWQQLADVTINGMPIARAHFVVGEALPAVADVEGMQERVQEELEALNLNEITAGQQHADIEDLRKRPPKLILRPGRSGTR